ncbi:MAG: hypothetical protein E7294_03855 [Lachnospiraceae bacterium]|jgi:hypothetical protein|nr:hypothetical protein [Lachnospiraceae bacterium]
MLKKRITITSVIVLALLTLLCAGLLMKNSRFFTVSTDLTRVVVCGYGIDMSYSHRIDTDGMNLTKQDMIKELGEDYGEVLYDYSQMLYRLTYYDKRHNRRLEIVYLNAADRPVAWIQVVSEEKR